MRQIENQNLKQLLLQFRFTPERRRLKQLKAAEQLYEIIDKDREYPFEFVCFRITGFHPKSTTKQQLIKGSELLDDLHIFLTKLSSRLARPVAEEGQKVYTIEEVATLFGVSKKTINRWRKQGLLARKFIFDDGMRRLGFLQSTIDKFARKNPELISKAKGFKRLANRQKQQIIKQARTLAGKTMLSRYQIINKIAAKVGTAHETVRYTLLDYEKSHPDKPIFKKPSGVMSPDEAAELYKLFQQGTSIKELMSHFNRNRSSIYRIINQQKAKHFLARKIEFIASDEFLEEGAREKILAKPIHVLKRAAGRGLEQIPVLQKESQEVAESTELVGEHLLPEYLQILKETPVLNMEREREFFRRYNYLKFLACERRADIKLSRVSSSLLTEIEDYLAEAEDVKRMIVEANLRLVVSIASKHASKETGFLELVSKGNFALIRAVEEFDYTKGFRFSKRASLSIAKEYAKVSGKSTELSREKAASLANIQRDLRSTAEYVLAAERTRHNLIQVIKDELDEREQYIIIHHFGLTGSRIRKNTKSLKQIGEDVGLTKERIRQIELVALQKLRQCLSSEEFELLTR